MENCDETEILMMRGYITNPMGVPTLGYVEFPFWRVVQCLFMHLKAELFFY